MSEGKATPWEPKSDYGFVLAKAEGGVAELSIKVNQARVGQTIELSTPIFADIEATLGKPQRTDKEEFVPLVVTCVV